MLAGLASLAEAAPGAAASAADIRPSSSPAYASLLQGALLVGYAPPAVADAFCASRLGSAGAGGPGTRSARCRTAWS